ncbi:reelin-like [Mizuhopecten yessoensis]|uniref:reelin-like n=2 Tax=Mizuhopecten yessoensis TaxID=6573 RepID=UPI000B4597C0|nr:reelin-like [Mizuhopecten yessoensis]
MALSYLSVLQVIFFLAKNTAGYSSYLEPFFFLCNYHGNTNDLVAERGEVAISVSVGGDPEYYTPGEFYNVSISSNQNFDGFLMTGLYTMSSSARTRLESLGYHGDAFSAQNLMCSIVHSHISPRPGHQLSFLWLAPVAGTGCVSFLATATLGHQMLFKDTTVLQLCEFGASAEPERPDTVGINTDSYLLRESFDTSSNFDPNIWASHDGTSINSDCGPVLHGDSALFCNRDGSRNLISVPLNLTSAAILQFTISAGRCGGIAFEEEDITVSLGMNNCRDWVVIDTISAPDGPKPETHLVHIPVRGQQDDVCIRWTQEPPTIPRPSPSPQTIPRPTPSPDHSPLLHIPQSDGPADSNDTKTVGKTKFKTYSIGGHTVTLRSLRGDTPETTDAPEAGAVTEGTEEYPPAGEELPKGPFKSCWALDNVLVVNTANAPLVISETFDPVDPSNWLFFPGANIQRKCRSEDNSMYFSMVNQTVNYVVTRDMDLSIEDLSDVMLEEVFELKQQPGWDIQGGLPDVNCGIIHEGNSLVFSSNGDRKACTPYMDTRGVGNLRFYFSMGSGSCHMTDSDDVHVLLYAENIAGHTMTLQKLLPSNHREARLMSVPVEGELRQMEVRFCWIQKFHNGGGQDVWAMDSVLVFPVTPQGFGRNRDKIVQFGINMGCATDPSSNRVDMQYSTDLGQTWHNLRTQCLHGSCQGNYQPVVSSFSSDDYPSWKMVTMPVPYVAMVPHVRLRWIQAQDGAAPNWAIDNVYIGDCPEGCQGHGVCTDGTCRCDFGYDGPTCEETVVPNPTELMENFADQSVLTSSSSLKTKGGQLSYVCGVLSSEKALVFNQAGPREIITSEFNTTHNRYLQFYIRVGSQSVTSLCPPPDRESESVILDYSCNGGISWHLIKIFRPSEFSSPKSDMVMLPEGARGTGCQFRWWQPEHSGRGRDVWAIDSLSLNSHLFNTLTMEMRDSANDTTPLIANFGKISDGYCDKRRSISFYDAREDGDQRFLMTRAMHVGPSYILQFDLVMGCHIMYSDGLDNDLYLEFSADHGLSWGLVTEPCLPPKSCVIFTEGTIYKPSKYTAWTQVTVPLPPATWGPVTKFRLRQPDWSPTDSWGVSRLYIGQQCPAMCSGHGQCSDGVCRCEEGFVGENCHTEEGWQSSMQADFGIRYEPDSDFLSILGGEVINGRKGCGTLLSGESLYFSGNGVRELRTKDFDTRESDYLQFYLRIGGGLPDCSGSETRQEGVILQFSTDGGTTWEQLMELVPAEYRKPKFVHTVLPPKARSPNTQFRWWQGSHSGGGQDQWAIDEIMLGSYDHKTKMEDNFNDHLDVLDSQVWSTVTEGVLGKYCQARDPALILANQENDKFAITKDLDLQTGDVIQFRLNVGCSNLFRLDHPVLLQYSHDGGQTWRLLIEPCYQEMDCSEHTEGTLYFSGPHGYWQTMIIPISQAVAMHPVLFRWWQPGGYAHSFALNDVYIGPPCPENCHREGLCSNGTTCTCNEGFLEPDCRSPDETPHGLLDWFDNHHKPRNIWRRIMGGKLGLGCGVVDYGNALFFNNEGTREAVTVPLNTTFLRMLQFAIRIGSDGSSSNCHQPNSRNEGVVVAFSTDNEVTWHTLKVVEPRIYNGSTEILTISLPPEAKTEATIFKWWQPLGYGALPRAEWGLDSVIVGVNETNSDGFHDDFHSMTPDPQNWMLTESAIPRTTCNSQGNALEFSRDKGLRFAVTHDFHVTPSMFLQFDIAMACDSLYGTIYGTLYSVELEYSVDMGQTWRPVVEECTPPNFECSGYHLSSEYVSDQHRNWTRVSVYLPPGAVSPTTRFRWMQHASSQRGNVWALDNVYLGDGCPWLCSGQGYCRNKTCVCDEGFAGPYCVPSTPLPMMLRDDFNTRDINTDNWREIYGGENSDICGKLVSGRSLTFHKENLRMVVSRDIDTSMLDTMEFSFKFGCNGEVLDWPRSESVLLQYSTNGGITWNLLKEIHYHSHHGARFFGLDLPYKARNNATRIRFWQPKNGGKMRSTWAVDNLFIGRMVMNPSSLTDNFDTQPLSDVWLFVNDGEVGSYCQHKTRRDTVSAGQSGLVFRRGPDSGEHYVVTKDMDVGPMSVLQFDINVGCEAESTDRYPVRLEYSPNGGKTWHLLVPNCAEVSSARCFDVTLHPSMYYGGTSSYWRRVLITLDTLYTCGSLRFRWYQGFVPDEDFGPEWAIDNVFIGMACMDNCLGHGECSNTMMCTCDPGYQGDSCHPANRLPEYLRDDFTQTDFVFTRTGGVNIPHDQPVDETKWWLSSGGQISDECGLLLSGTSLHFNAPGERMLVSRDLDLSNVSTVQFFLRLGCEATPLTDDTLPVYLQSSINGGVSWQSIEQFDFNQHSNRPAYYALHLPEKARTNSTHLRWWQPSLDGSFTQNWAIDQIYIGGDVQGMQPLLDDAMTPRETSWLMYPGGEIEHVCGSLAEAIHFQGEGPMRYATSADVMVEEGTFVQFDIAMGCSPSLECYSIDIQYSHDMGNSWKLLQAPCLPSDIDCGRFYPGSSLVSDVHTGWNRVTIPMPHYTRSKSTRLMWVQAGWALDKQPWAVSYLYIGKDCPSLCGGHGRCSSSGCLCDDGWTGFECSTPIKALSTYLYDTFTNGIDHTLWSKVVGAMVTEGCEVLASGNTLHFMEDCSRLLISHDLDLSNATMIQFYFMFGCNAAPVTRNQGVLVDYSTDGGSTWTPIMELYYALYRSPRFVHADLPEGAKRRAVRIRWWQPTHGGRPVGDWVLDNVRIGGHRVNPSNMIGQFSDDLNDHDWLASDNMVADDYCGESHVAKGTTLVDENSVLTTQDIHIEENYMLQFEINVGCGQEWNVSGPPVLLQYSSDSGLHWYNLKHQCLPDDPQCNGGPQMSTLYFSEPMGMWRRVTMKLEGLPVSSGTRLRWTQKADRSEGDTHMWGVRQLYVGPPCEHHCSGRGTCNTPQCSCDSGYGNTDCSHLYSVNPTYLKDNFEGLGVDMTKWSLVQGGHLGSGCHSLVENSAMVMSGPGNRQLVTGDLDLRNARFIQYYAVIGGSGSEPGCFPPTASGHSVILQYSTDNGMHWDTLHVLDYASYQDVKKDYILLPQGARTESTKVRWWQPLSGGYSQSGPQWEIDEVHIGGTEINPSEMQVSFDDTDDQDIQSDAPWEFTPHGEIREHVCTTDGHAVAWDEGKGTRSFTSSQMIVQHNYMLQFKIVVGCDVQSDACVSHSPVKLLYNKNPATDRWEYVQPLCLPDLNGMQTDCRPSHYHSASAYSPEGYPAWTLVTIDLPDTVYSSATRFRWLQEATNSSASSWALDDVYVGEKCPGMCSGRGACLFGSCVCHEGYTGFSCEKITRHLIRKMSDSFEGGVFPFYWDTITGGGIGFGCGALLPYAHGKTLYFNDCGLRQMVTVEMDLRRASKLMFVLQIGCRAQTSTCNVKTGTGVQYRGVLLQYTKDRGTHWKLLARHDPEDYLNPKRAAYTLPEDAQDNGVQFRWWQPVHDGEGHDQWAVDHVEIITNHNSFSRFRRSKWRGE